MLKLVLNKGPKKLESQSVASLFLQEFKKSVDAIMKKT
jgi:hypothetical protein